MLRTMPRPFALLVACAAAGAVTGQAVSQRQPAHEPQRAFEWRTATPESVGFCGPALARLQERLAKSDTKALLVIRHDAIALEWYAADHGPSRRHYTASMAKALVAGLSVAVALTDERLALDDPVVKYVPQWGTYFRKSRITLRQLGSHTSGLEDAEENGIPHAELTGWKGDFWRQLEPPRDPFTLARDFAEVLFSPGERFYYSNPGIAMLTYATTAAYRDGPWRDIRTLLRERVMRPIGVGDGEWEIGYGRTYRLDGLSLVPSWGGGNYTARAVARVGRLMLRGGDWDGTRVLSEEAVRLITTDTGLPGHAGIGWWSNSEGRYPELPRDAFWGSGAQHQVLFVVPAFDVIAVRNGGSLGEARDHHDTLAAELFTPLLSALLEAGPCSGSPAAGRSGSISTLSRVDVSPR